MKSITQKEHGTKHHQYKFPFYNGFALFRDALPTPPDSLMKKRTKLPRVEDQTAPPPRVDSDGEANNRE